jgi:hypothetical protein
MSLVIALPWHVIRILPANVEGDEKPALCESKSMRVAGVGEERNRRGTLVSPADRDSSLFRFRLGGCLGGGHGEVGEVGRVQTEDYRRFVV